MNIENELRAILDSEGDQADELNLLVDEFRKGRDSWELLCLLNASDSELVRIGAWIASEVSFDLYNTPVIIDRLRELTHHETPLVRLYALSAFFPSLDRTNSASLELVSRLRKDENKGVRMGAEAAARRLGLESY